MVFDKKTASILPQIIRKSNSFIRTNKTNKKTVGCLWKPVLNASKPLLQKIKIRRGSKSRTVRVFESNKINWIKNWVNLLIIPIFYWRILIDPENWNRTKIVNLGVAKQIQ